MNPTILTLLQSYIEPMLSSNMELRSLSLKSLDNLLRELLIDQPDSQEIIYLKQLSKSSRTDYSCLRDLIETIAYADSKRYIEIRYNQYFRLDLFDNKKVINPNAEVEIILEYLFGKGAVIQEISSRIRYCKILLAECRVFKYQLFNIADSIVHITCCTRINSLRISIDNNEREITNGENIIRFEQYCITAMLIGENWHFQGKFFKYLHNSYTQEQNEETTYELYLGDQPLQIVL